MANEKEKQDLSIDEKIALALEAKEKDFELRLKQRETNEAKIAGTCAELIMVEGKPIIDKETKQQKEFNGELCFYPNRYSYRHSFDGGSIEISLNKEKYDSMIVGARYLAVGRFASVTEFGNTIIKPVFSHFQKI